MPRSFIPAVLALAALPGLTACVPSSTPAVAPAGRDSVATRGPQARYGVIVSVRPLLAEPPAQAAAPGAAREDVRTHILGVVGSAAGGGVLSPGTRRGAEAREFIIRLDNGGTLSLVQPNEERFRPGERVQILSGEHTRMARAT
ncbi:conserved exported protein of unknown function [Rhodovastum atsumiense]|uniref:Uncharacterized protein n=1 Tax=Rhodovastum atsumiense TaxID=504468 RepID=A0A5M6ITX8_9PROT|nr:hypothetical protein [Rhodovastum atsumiense]KAA5611671.1 hypothetical protein F1189_12795 [Rhodovastum atsumiense]CAH2604244.1 conserved exported protein of unknown function [Rhodovastum atsumiense]